MIEAFRRQTLLAGRIMSEHLKKGDSAVDGTAGTGADTLLMAEQVGEVGRVYTFDIQDLAIEKTKKLLSEHQLQDVVHLYHCGHEKIKEFDEITEDFNIRGAMFNLGYLPGGDHTLVTRAETTMTALKDTLDLLTPDGLLTVCVYRHPEGMEEYLAIEKWCSELGKGIDVYRVDTMNHKNSPILYLIKKQGM